MMNLQAGQAFVDPFTGEEAFAVEPITNCPHALSLDFKKIEDTIYQQGQKLFWSKCVDCENVGENWVCLICINTYCSRYIKEHMVKHYQQNLNHQVAISFSDLSFWCYECDSYITNQDLSKLRKLFQKAKFNEDNFSERNKAQQLGQKEIEEISQMVMKGNGFFIPGDVNQQQAFQKDIIIQKGVLKGFQSEQNKINKLDQFIVKEDEEAVGSVIRFIKNIDQITREKLTFLINEIQSYPTHSSIKFEKVKTGDEFIELAVYYSYYQ